MLVSSMNLWFRINLSKFFHLLKIVFHYLRGIRWHCPTSTGYAPKSKLVSIQKISTPTSCAFNAFKMYWNLIKTNKQIHLTKNSKKLPQNFSKHWRWAILRALACTYWRLIKAPTFLFFIKCLKSFFSIFGYMLFRFVWTYDLTPYNITIRNSIIYLWIFTLK